MKKTNFASMLAVAGGLAVATAACSAPADDAAETAADETAMSACAAAEEVAEAACEAAEEVACAAEGCCAAACCAAEGCCAAAE
ncbi:hypothetical protein [Erythrobacter sp. F6033]|uniref:hypothetical protein n=1 Tax=Erythrobacter sp. F6033 TaxID=2926401 RepID=UPI001FF2EF50|nr:hypothetical protein [Erythrobacter sp. F6033]MCK0127970.1 hypothetical protein [Erythrobacter sp. F6033]